MNLSSLERPGRDASASAPAASAGAGISLAASDARTPLVGLTRQELEDLAVSWGEPRYRGRQLASWIYARGVDSPEAMTDLPAALRSTLAARAEMGQLRLLRRQVARDGTEKLLLGLPDGEAIETVVLPFPDRTSLCVSSQVGCPVRCSFCATGRSGYARNLAAGEIVEQLLTARRLTGRTITHVVFMGMGEPLLNLRRVLKAARLINDEIGIPMRRITISTVGLVPEMLSLAEEHEQFTLAVSLHAPEDALRERLIPVARRYPLQSILSAADYYQRQTGRRVTFEYVLLRGVNDQPEQARQLARLLQGRRAHVNLIPYNPGASDEYRAPGLAEILGFRRTLEEAGVAVTQRMEKGQDIMAACGQLRAQAAPAARDPGSLIALRGA
jgi:23S rRNA (adenine2503-C2)-methyltransferase